MNWETLLAFGDSITFGARSYLGYPEICGDILSTELEKKWHVINHATNGHTTIDLVRSINPMLLNYKSAYPSLITVMIGTNDIKNQVDINDFRIAFDQLIIKLKLMAVGGNIILIKIPRFTQKVFYPYKHSMNEQIAKFNACIENLANKNNLRCFECVLDDDDFFDGVHLSPKGCHTVAAQLSVFILKDKGVESPSALQ
jgi:lysophospholipase L1-like esterase